MSITDELREMLDERGVKWEAYDEFELTTQWETHDGAFVYWARERDGKLLVETTAPTKCSLLVTPDQAVAATLWNGMCHKVLDFDGTVWICSECGEHIGPRRWNFCPNCGRRIEGGK